MAPRSSRALRIGWAVVGALTGERMDRTNMLVAAVLIVFMICVVPCLYTSFTHRRQFAAAPPASWRDPLEGLLTAVTCLGILNQSLLRFGALGAAPTSDLHDFFGGAPDAEAAAAHARAIYAARSDTFLLPATLHTAAWTVALFGGAALLRRMRDDPCAATARPRLSAACLLAVIAIGLTAADTRYNRAISFSFLLARPSPEDAHFYKFLPTAFWNLKVASLWTKTAVCALTALTGDETRALEWAMYAYGDLATYQLLLPATWLFQALLPTFEDAWVHAMLVSSIGMPLLYYVRVIYLFAPQVDHSVRAKRFGLFSSLRPRRKEA